MAAAAAAAAAHTADVNVGASHVGVARYGSLHERPLLLLAGLQGICDIERVDAQ